VGLNETAEAKRNVGEDGNRSAAASDVTERQDFDPVSRSPTWLARMERHLTWLAREAQACMKAR
jgi:hypothetical protein